MSQPFSVPIFEPEPEVEGASLSEAWGPLFRTQNTIGAAIADARPGVDRKTEDPLPDEWFDELPDRYRPFISSFNGVTQQDADHWIETTDQEIEDLELISRLSTAEQIAGGLAVALPDAPTLLLGGIGGATTLGGRVAAGVGLGAADAVLTEALLLPTQVTRTNTDRAVSVAASALLGGVLGGGVHAISGRAGDNIAATKVALDRDEDIGPPQAVGGDAFPDSVGAAATDRVTNDDLSLASEQEAILRATPTALAPNVRAAKSSSAAGKSTMYKLLENDFDLVNLDRTDIGPAVETLIKVKTDAFSVKMERALMRGQKISGSSKRKFNEDTGRAMRRGDLDQINQGVTSSAQDLRKEVYDPLLNEAISLGMLPADVKVETAASYFARSWNTEKLVAERDVFIARTTNWAKGELEALEFARQAEGFRGDAAQDINVLRRKQEVIDKARTVDPDIDEDGLASLFQTASAERGKVQSVRDFVTARGGISKADPQANDITPYSRPGFLRANGGLSLDKMREAAAEEGYLPMDSTVADFVDLLSEDIGGGTRAYRPADLDDVANAESIDEAFGELARLGISKEEARGLMETFGPRKSVDARDPQEIDSDAIQTATDIWTQLTGGEAATDATPFQPAVTRGPLKDRTFSAPDEMFEDFLDSNAANVTARHIRTMVAEIELTKAFGRADMQDQIREVETDYRSLLDEATTPAERTRLKKEQDKMVDAIRTSRDILRGTHLAQSHASKLAAAARVLKGYNFVRALGGVVTSAIPDVSKHVMVHGMQAVTGDGFRVLRAALPDLTTKEVRSFVKREAEAAGIAEVLLNTRAMAYADLDNPYQRVGAVERFSEGMTKWGATLSGSNHWNQIMKEWASGLYIQRMNRVMDAGFENASKGDLNYLRTLKIGKADAAEIFDELRAHRTQEGKLFDPNTHLWTNDRARSVFLAAMRQDADSIIVTPGVGTKVQKVGGADLTHFAASLALQFKNFWIASHQRTMMRMAANPDRGRVVSGTIMATALGMFAFYLKTVQANRELPDNLGTWLAEGIDRSGMIPLYMEMNNVAEGVGAPGLYRMLGEMGVVAGSGDGPKRASRFAQRNAAGAALGPSAGVISDVRTIAKDLIDEADPRAKPGEGIQPSTITATRRLTPFANHPGVKEFLSHFLVPELQEAVE